MNVVRYFTALQHVIQYSFCAVVDALPLTHLADRWSTYSCDGLLHLKWLISWSLALLKVATQSNKTVVHCWCRNHAETDQDILADEM